jgi:hypothetical protein
LIARHNRVTFNRIFGAFGVVSSRVAAALQMTCQRPLFFNQIVESTRIIFGSGLAKPRRVFWLILGAPLILLLQIESLGMDSFGS